MKYPPVPEKTVLVTGCSSGIGAATANVLRDAGWTVFPTARKQADLNRLEADGFHPVALDTADEVSVARAAETVLQQVEGRLGGVVNNAGFGQGGAVEDLSREALRYQFEVNLIGMQDLTNRLIPAFRRQGAGRIVNVGSIVGKISLPFFGAYSASKFAMEGLSDAMRVELQPTGISVSVVEPGPIATRFSENAGARADTTLQDPASPFEDLYRKERERREQPGQDRNARFRLPPEAVAEKIRHALESSRPKTRYPVTFPAHLGVVMKRFLPDRFIDWIMIERWKKVSGSQFNRDAALSDLEN